MLTFIVGRLFTRLIHYKTQTHTHNVKKKRMVTPNDRLTTYESMALNENSQVNEKKEKKIVNSSIGSLFEDDDDDEDVDDLPLSNDIARFHLKWASHIYSIHRS